MEPVMLEGERVRPLPATSKVRDYAMRQWKRLPSEYHHFATPAAYPVVLSDELKELQRTVREGLRVTQA